MNTVFIHQMEERSTFLPKGHSSIGGYDIFKTTLRKGKWSKPENLGYLLIRLEMILILCLPPDEVLKKTRLLFFTYRANGMGSDDIYKFTFPDAKNLLMKVIVLKVN